MQKIKVVTFNGALKLLKISNRTFYVRYRPYVKPCGKQGNASLYKIDDLLNREKAIQEEKKYNAKYEIIE